MRAYSTIVKGNKFRNIMCFFMLQYLMCGASALTSQIHAATIQFTIIQCAHFGCMPKKVVYLHVPYEPTFVENY